jgi:hypothetical protein
MTLTQRRGTALAALGLALAFGAAFLVGRASAGGSGSSEGPTHVVLAPAHVTVHGAVPAAELPPMHAERHHTEVAPPTSTPSAPSTAPAAPSESTPPSTGGSSGGGGGSSGGGSSGGGGGPVIVQ